MERRNIIEDLSVAAEAAGRYIEFLRCGRDAIGFVADDIIAGFQDDGISREDGGYKAFLPALACDSMVLPFEVRGYEIVYYKVKVYYHQLPPTLDGEYGSRSHPGVIAHQRAADSLVKIIKSVL